MVNDWTTYLPGDIYERLCSCHNSKSDLPILVNTRWGWMREQTKYKGFVKEDALVYILGMLESNSQYRLTDLTVDEYNELAGR